MRYCDYNGSVSWEEYRPEIYAGKCKQKCKKRGVDIRTIGRQCLDALST